MRQSADLPGRPIAACVVACFFTVLSAFGSWTGCGPTGSDNCTTTNVGIGFTTASPIVPLMVRIPATGPVFRMEANGGNSTLLTLASDVMDAYLPFNLHDGGGVSRVYIPNYGGHAYFNNLGNFGVGTTNPAGGKLHVYTTTNADGIAVDGTTNPAINFRNAGTVAGYLGLATQSTAFFAEALPNDLIIRSENNRILLGRGSGASTLSVAGPNVGIGTATPQALMHLYQSGTAVEMLRLDNPMGAVETGNKLTFHQGGNEDAYIDSHYDTTNGWALRFGTRNAGNNAADRVIISNGGNVGIGTMAPTHILDAYGPADNTFPNSPLTASLGGTAAYSVANSGAGLNFSVLFNSAGQRTTIGAISAIKESTTDGAYGGALVFGTRRNGSGAESMERMRIDSNGVVSINGTTLGTDTSDKLIVNGAIRAVSVIGATYQDVAEWVPATESIAPGTVVIVDANAVNGVAPSNRPYDTAVAGVISAQPGVLLGREGPSKVKVATTGRVKVHVDASRFPIHPGDLLVSADKPGMAMRSEPVEIAGLKMHRPGTLIGKALEPLQSGEGEILVLLSLQ